MVDWSSYKAVDRLGENRKMLLSRTEFYCESDSDESDPEDQNDGKEDCPDGKLICQDIVASDMADNVDLLARSVNDLRRLISSEKRVDLDLLLEYNILEILVKRSVGHDLSRLVMASYHCLSKISLVFFRSADSFVEMGLDDVFLGCFDFQVTRMTQYSICGLDSLVMGSRSFLESLISKVRPSQFVRLLNSETEFDVGAARLISRAARYGLIRPISWLFQQFSSLPIEPAEIDVVLDFFLSLFSKNDADPIAARKFKLWGLEGISALLSSESIHSRHFAKLEILPDLLDVDEYDDLSSTEEGTDPYLCFACDVIGGLLQIGVQTISLDLRDVIRICEEAFHLPLGIAGYKLLEMIAKNCDGLLMSLALNGIDTLNRGILAGCFQVRASAEYCLQRIIDEPCLELLEIIVKNRSFLDVFFALMDREEVQAQVLERMNVLLERSICSADEDDLAAFRAAIEDTQGVSRLAQIIETSGNERAQIFAERFVTRFHEVSS
jgi:hypothetical protein